MQSVCGRKTNIQFPIAKEGSARKEEESLQESEVEWAGAPLAQPWSPWQFDIHPTLLAATLIVILVTTPRRCPHPSGRGHSATSLATAELGLKPSIAPGDTLDGHIRHSEILKGGGEDSATNLHIYFFH